MSNNLPVARIKTIMKSSADVETISRESLQLVTVATELFIKHLAQRAEKVSNGKEILYRDIADVVSTSERYDFLSEIIPRKITVRQFKEICSARAREDTSEESDSDSDSDVSSSSVTTGSGSSEDSSTRLSPGSK